MLLYTYLMYLESSHQRTKESYVKSFRASSNDAFKISAIREKQDLEHVLVLKKKNNIINECYKKAEHYINLASNSLSVYEESEEKNILKNLTSFSIERNF